MSESREREFWAQAALAAPLAVGYLGNQLMGLVDTAMLGRHSDVALAGAGIANGLFGAITVLGVGIVMGMDSLVPQAVGAGEGGRARSLLRHGLRTAAFLTIPLTIAGALAPLLMMLLGVQSEARSEATVYLFGRLPGVLPLLIFTVLRSYLQAHSVTRPMVVAVIVGNLVNVVGNAVLIFGDGALVFVGLPAVGLPAFGSLGAAISSALVSWASMFICVAPALALYRKSEAESPERPPERPVAQPGAEQPTGISPTWSPTRSILRMGVPVGLHLLAEVGVFALVAVLAGRLGTTEAAAHQIAITTVSFAFSAVFGVGSAASVRVGLAVGVGDHRRARTAGLVGMAIGAGFLSMAAIVYLVIPEPLIRLMTDQPEVIATAVPLFYVAAAFQIGDALQAASAGALRGAGDTRSPMWAHLIGNYGIGVTVGVLSAFVFEHGAVGLWWGLGAGLSFAGLALSIRFVYITSRPIARAE